MKNIAGWVTEAADEQCRRELEAAGFDVVVAAEPRKAEVATRITGRFGQSATLTRAWYYWVVKLNSPMPLALATRLHFAPDPEDVRSNLGRVVRVDGHCGAPAPTADVSCYHVDTQTGLVALQRYVAWSIA